MRFNDGKDSEIRVAPPPPKLQVGPDSQWMDWTIVSSQPVEESVPGELERAIPIAGYSVQIERSPPNTLNIRVCQHPIAGYTELYDTCLRTLLICERIVGTLEAINGFPRERYWATFVVAQNRCRLPE